VIHDVIAVGAARGSLKIGRTIEMTDTERRQIINNGGGGSEIKSLVELDPIGRPQFKRHAGAP
jgi:hypothetical protein